MTEEDIKNKNLVLIDFLKSKISGYKIKGEYSTNDNDIKVIVVQETSGQKVVFYGNIANLYNYYNVDIYGNNIKEAKDTSVEIGNLIGKTFYLNWKNQKWQIIIMQFANPKTIMYEDIRRVAYTSTLHCVVNRVA